MHYNVNKAIISKVLHQNLSNRNCYKPEYAFYTIITRQVYKNMQKNTKMCLYIMSAARFTIEKVTKVLLSTSNH